METATPTIEKPRWTHPGGKLIEEGPQSLKQAELLAIVIGSGIPGTSALDLAKAILEEYISLYGLFQKKATVEGLSKIKGVKTAKAERALAAIRIARLLHCRKHERKKLEASQWDETELLSRVLGSGIAGHSSRQIAGEILSRYGSLEGLYGAPMNKLERIKGLDAVKIIRLAAVFEISYRLNLAFSM